MPLARPCAATADGIGATPAATRAHFARRPWPIDEGAPPRRRPLERQTNDQQGEHFAAAIARHQLALSTELKRSTSLPSAMFDASDPMLEARLCEATEGIFRLLLEHDAPPDAVTTGELRLEAVAPQELAELVLVARRGAFADPAVPKLAEHEDVEFQALLAETCARSHGAAQQRAAQLLRGQRELGPNDLDALTHELATRLGALRDGTDAAAAEAMIAACRKLAATVLHCTDPDGEGPPA